MSDLSHTFDQLWQQMCDHVQDARLLGMNFVGNLGKYDARQGVNNLEVCAKGTLFVLTDQPTESVEQCISDSGVFIRCGVRDLGLAPKSWADRLNGDSTEHIHCFNILLPQAQFPELEFVIMQDRLREDNNTVNYHKEVA